MRHLPRPALKPALAEFLDRMQAFVDSGAEITSFWKSKRSRADMREIARVLAGMTGTRERCMYCEDSRGTDIEHFRPKTPYPGYAFRWSNLLWICTACNRSKGTRFPCDEDGNPLLVDPTLDEPWDLLFFDPETGNITARWDPVSGEENPKGKALLEILSPLGHQAVTEGRKKVVRQLKREVRSFLGLPRDGARAVSEEEIQSLLECVADTPDYGIALWFFVRDGQEEEPFRTLRTQFPSVWDRIASHLIVPH